MVAYTCDDPTVETKHLLIGKSFQQQFSPQWKTKSRNFFKIEAGIPSHLPHQHNPRYLVEYIQYVEHALGWLSTKYIHVKKDVFYKR
jgi:hypothetical protein